MGAVEAEVVRSELWVRIPEMSMVVTEIVSNPNSLLRSKKVSLLTRERNSRPHTVNIGSINFTTPYREYWEHKLHCHWLHIQTLNKGVTVSMGHVDANRKPPNDAPRER